MQLEGRAPAEVGHAMCLKTCRGADKETLAVGRQEHIGHAVHVSK